MHDHPASGPICPCADAVRQSFHPPPSLLEHSASPFRSSNDLAAILFVGCGFAGQNFFWQTPLHSRRGSQSWQSPSTRSSLGRQAVTHSPPTIILGSLKEQESRATRMSERKREMPDGQWGKTRKETRSGTTPGRTGSRSS